MERFWARAAWIQFVIIAIFLAAVFMDREAAIDLINELPEFNSDPTPTATISRPTPVPQRALGSPDPTAAPNATPTATPTPSPTPLPTRTPVPDLGPTGLSQFDLDAGRQLALNLINAARREAGIVEVVLDDNPTAQLQANQSRRDCTLSPWGTDGMKPYMRYTLSGGTQYSTAILHGAGFCPYDAHRYDRETLSEEIRFAHRANMEHPSHRENILDPTLRRVSIGISSRPPNVWIIQLFTTDFVELPVAPTIENGVLSFAYRLRNGAVEPEDPPLAYLEHDTPPHELTRGQLARTHCYAGGREIAGLRPPAGEGWFWTDETFEAEASTCPDPYFVPRDAPPPASYDEFEMLSDEAEIQSVEAPISVYVVPWITVNVEPLPFGGLWVQADVSEQIAFHGPGVYTLVIWANVDGRDTPVSEYSIFVD